MWTFGVTAADGGGGGGGSDVGGGTAFVWKFDGCRLKLGANDGDAEDGVATAAGEFVGAVVGAEVVSTILMEVALGEVEADADAADVVERPFATMVGLATALIEGGVIVCSAGSGDVGRTGVTTALFGEVPADPVVVVIIGGVSSTAPCFFSALCFKYSDLEKCKRLFICASLIRKVMRCHYVSPSVYSVLHSL